MHLIVYIVSPSLNPSVTRPSFPILVTINEIAQLGNHMIDLCYKTFIK